MFITLAGICGLISTGQAPPAYAKAVSSWFDERRGLALGIAMAGIGIGATAVPQFARWAIDTFGWRAAYVALGALTFAVAFPSVALLVREPEDPVQEGRRHTAHDAIWSQRLPNR